MSRKVLIAAGGTGGHLFPAQQLAEMLKDDSDILFAGHKIGNSPFFEKEKIPFAEIFAHPLKRGFLSATWKGFWQAWKLIRMFKPDVVVGFGSYYTFPVLLASAVLRKKLVLFEANCVLGKVNRLFRPAASQMAFQFPVKNGLLVPLLPWKEKEGLFLGVNEAKKIYGLDPNRKTILVFGGSQGAAFLNEQAPAAIFRLKEKFQVIHLTGPKDAETVRATYQKLGITASIKPFEKEMAYAYAAADLALCRSGAGTVAELIRFELPALLIPYPFAADDHQRVNGQFLSEIGGARLLIQAEANLERMALELDALASETEARRKNLHTENTEHRKRTHLADIVRRLAQ